MSSIVDNLAIRLAQARQTLQVTALSRSELLVAAIIWLCVPGATALLAAYFGCKTIHCNH